MSDNIDNTAGHMRVMGSIAEPLSPEAKLAALETRIGMLEAWRSDMQSLNTWAHRYMAEHPVRQPTEWGTPEPSVKREE